MNQWMLGGICAKWNPDFAVIHYLDKYDFISSVDFRFR